MSRDHSYRHSRCRSVRAFTIVELLVVIGMMSVLTGIFSVALSSARVEARIKRCNAEVRSISVILQQKLNDISLAPVSLIGSTGTAVDSVEQNRVTMLARRDLSRMILPQCRADLIYPPSRLQVLLSSGPSAVKVKTPNEWSQMRRYAGFDFPHPVQIESPLTVPFRVFSNAFADSLTQYLDGGTEGTTLRGTLGSLDGYVLDLEDSAIVPWPEGASPPVNETWTRDFESAECLYLILASTETLGERAIDQIHARSIANLDSDAVPEIVDPWGVPYEFVRDPVGRAFIRVPQAPPATGPLPSHGNGPDSTDYLRTDLRHRNNVPTTRETMIDAPFQLRPLIVSAGPDGEFGMRRTFNREGSFALDRMGISPRHSTAATHFLSLTPPLPGGVLLGTYQYPDPYVQFRNSITSPYQSAATSATTNFFRFDFATITNATLASWYSDGTTIPIGLGAALIDANGVVEEAFADNVFSDTAE